MSAEEVPVEILVMILSNLNGKEAVACRAVCRRWRAVVDSLPDAAWERHCCRDFRNPKAPQNHKNHKVANPCNLSYRDLYKSLALWSKIEQAEVTCKKVSEKFVHHFKILNNDTLAILGFDFKTSYTIIYNQIQYYNLTNMELISTERYDFKFLVYDENEKLIVLLGVDERLWVIIKSNKKKLCLVLHDNRPLASRSFKLFDTVVYYVNRQRFLCAAQLKVVDSEEAVVIVELTAMRHSVVAFASPRKNSVYILTRDAILVGYCGADMIAFINLSIESEGSTLITYLMEFGFDWTDPYIFFHWLRRISNNKNLGVPAMDTTAVHTHNHILLVGTNKRTMRIFTQPYKMNKTIEVYNSKPNTTIIEMPSSIQQLGVVEVLNGHRIIALLGINNKRQLFFVDLLHNTTTKQSAQSTDPSTSAKKKSRIATKKSGRVTKHGYNTRSMDRGSRITKKKQ